MAKEAEPLEYWVLMWREKDDWGWLRSLDGDDDCTTQDPARRTRYSSPEAAKVALWKFRRDNAKRPNETVRLVRVLVKRRGT